MKEFNELSGPWAGFSVQFSLRISEQMHLRIEGGVITGSGFDKDGDFEVIGSYHRRTHRVTLTRRYTWSPEPNGQNVGIPYQYEGFWDGAMVSGTWFQRNDTSNNGTFEMWPSRDKELADLRLESHETASVG